jgi:hypothetical protein
MLTPKRFLKHVPFSDATVLTLTHAHINVEALEWNSDGRSQAQHLGGKTTPDALSLDKTKKQIRYIRKHIAFEVSQILRSSECSCVDSALQTEAGCRILINTIMLHAVTNLDTSIVGVTIAPEFRRIPYTALDSGGSSFAGAVDYLMALGTPSVRGRSFVSRTVFTSDDFQIALCCPPSWPSPTPKSINR